MMYQHLKNLYIDLMVEEALEIAETYDANSNIYRKEKIQK